MNPTISLAQMAVADRDPGKNLDTAGQMVAAAASQGAELVVLPEMWTTGLDGEWNMGLAGENGPILDEISGLAAKNRVWMAGSALAFDARGRAVNRLMLHDPQGRLAASYDKTHLFTPGQEHRTTAPGNGPVVAKTPWGRMGFAVCYDLRFPELFVSYAMADVDAVIVSACFPRSRAHVWRTLVQARAMETQMAMIAVCTPGRGWFGPGNEDELLAGDSMVVDATGEIVAMAGAKPGLVTCSLDISLRAKAKQFADFMADRRPEAYKVPEKA